MFRRCPGWEHSRELSISHNTLIRFLKVHKPESNIQQLNITLAFFFLIYFCFKADHPWPIASNTGAITRWGNREGRVGVKVTDLEDHSAPQCLEVVHL